MRLVSKNAIEWDERIARLLAEAAVDSGHFFEITRTIGNSRSLKQVLLACPDCGIEQLTAANAAIIFPIYGFRRTRSQVASGVRGIDP
jgi:hypothetical protein